MKKIIYFLFLSVLLTSCYEDKSSDRYDPIGSLSIEGIEEEYDLVSLLDALVITPTVRSTDPADSRFEYLWTLYPNQWLGSDTNPQPHPIDTLSQEKDLSYDVALDPGNYTVALRVTNADNGYTVYSRTTLRVNTQFTTGYYFLKETAGGNTDLDFLTPAGDLVADLLVARLGAPITGKPTRLGYVKSYNYVNDNTGQASNGQVLMAMAEKDLRIMNISDMSLVYDFRTMFFEEKQPDEKPVTFFTDFFSRPYFFTNKGIYMSQGGSTGKYGFITKPSTGDAELSPYCVISTGSFTLMFNFFDEKSNRLAYINYNGAWQEMSSNTINLDSLYQYRRDLLMMGTNGWAVFQDEGNPSARYLYKLLLTSGRNPITEIRTIDPALNFCRAQVYASNKSGDTRMLYGGVGDKLYMYNTGDDSEKLLSPAGMSSGEQITMITHKIAAPETYLMIGTHKDGNYKVYMYTLAAGEPYGDPVVTASGQGKVVDMHYVNPNLSSSYNFTY